jgi:hypothetical protein
MSEKFFKDGESKAKDRIHHSAAKNPIKTQYTGTQSHSKDRDPLVKSGKAHKGK